MYLYYNEVSQTCFVNEFPQRSWDREAIFSTVKSFNYEDVWLTLDVKRHLVICRNSLNDENNCTQLHFEVIQLSYFLGTIQYLKLYLANPEGIKLCFRILSQRD